MFDSARRVGQGEAEQGTPPLGIELAQPTGRQEQLLAAARLLAKQLQTPR